MSKTMTVKGLTDTAIIEITVPIKREVCYRCDGEGTHVNPNADYYTASEWRELDDETRDHYMQGVYDVTCTKCNGRNVLDVPDIEAMSDEHRKAYQDYLDDEAQYQANAAWERQNC